MCSEARETYKIRNWAEYNDALIHRYDVTFWFSENVLSQWRHENGNQGQGRPFTFSDLAIETLLTMRELFQLPYRGTEGFGRWVFRVMRLDLEIPGYAALCKRAKKLAVDLSVREKRGKINVIVDSTGLKVYGEGEWKTRTHGKSRRRTWRKLHLGVNADTQEIEAELLTHNGCHDSHGVAPLRKQIRNKVGSLYGDGTYDTWEVRGGLARTDTRQIIPPSKNAKIKRHGNRRGPRLERDDAIRFIRRHGRKAWKKHIGYHRRSLGETTMFRLKTIFGGRLKNRLLENQKTESRLRCKILNHFTRLGLPKYT